jgi:DNA ligase (NAD+)
MLRKLEKLGVNYGREEQATTGGNLSGQTFLFTGTLSRFKRSEAEEMVEKNGGKILGGVSSKLNYTIAVKMRGIKLQKAGRFRPLKLSVKKNF